MTTIQTIGVDRSKAIISNGNSDFTVQFNSPYILGDGNALIMKNAYLNSNQLSGSNISIPEDITVVIEFGYYVVNGVQTLTIKNPPNNPVVYQYSLYPQFLTNMEPPEYPTGPGYPQLPNYYTNGVDLSLYSEPTDFQTYVLSAYRDGVYTPQIGRLEIPIKKGEYTPQQIANNITEKGSSINGRPLQVPITIDNPYPILVPGTNLLFPCVDDDDNVYVFTSDYVSGVTNMTTVPQFKYAIPINNIPVIPNIDGLVPIYYAGTNQFALDYDDISESFQFSYLHYPLTNAADDNDATVVARLSHEDFMAGTTDKVVSAMQTQSKVGGVFITKLEPAWFWEQLGFVLDDVVVDIGTAPNYVIDIAKIKAKSTDAQLGLSTLPSIGITLNNPVVLTSALSNAVPPVPNPTLTFISDPNIIPLKARGPYSSSNSGFYYIVADFGSVGNYYSDGRDVIGQMSGIVSKQFTQNDFITGFGDSAIPYIHNGEPTMLSTVRIRIYDRNMKLATNLGPNTVIFFQIISQDVTPVVAAATKNPVAK